MHIIISPNKCYPNHGILSRPYGIEKQDVCTVYVVYLHQLCSVKRSDGHM